MSRRAIRPTTKKRIPEKYRYRLFRMTPFLRRKQPFPHSAIFSGRRMIKRWRVLVGKKKSNACLLVFLLQDLSCGIFVIYLFDNMLDNVIAIDNKIGAFGANVFLPIEVLFADRKST